MDYLISISDQLAPQIRSLRKVRRLSQTELALKLGVSQSRIAAIERHPSTVSVGQLLDLFKALNVDLILRDNQATVAETSRQPAKTDPVTGGEW